MPSRPNPLTLRVSCPIKNPQEHLCQVCKHARDSPQLDILGAGLDVRQSQRVRAPVMEVSHAILHMYITVHGQTVAKPTRGHRPRRTPSIRQEVEKHCAFVWTVANMS